MAHQPSICSGPSVSFSQRIAAPQIRKFPHLWDGILFENAWNWNKNWNVLLPGHPSLATAGLRRSLHITGFDVQSGDPMPLGNVSIMFRKCSHNTRFFGTFGCLGFQSGTPCDCQDGQIDVKFSPKICWRRPAFTCVQHAICCHHQAGNLPWKRDWVEIKPV